MSSQYENQDSLKNQPFYNEEIEQTEKNKKKHKKSKKKYTKKQRNKLTIYKVLRNILPMHDTTIITRKAYDFKGDAATYDVEVRDKKSLEGSLFSIKPTINELFTEIRKNIKGLKYYISTRVNVKKWDSSSETTTYDVIYDSSTPIEVTNLRFYLNKSF